MATLTQRPVRADRRRRALLPARRDRDGGHRRRRLFASSSMGRSTFASPLRVHLHASAFMGWVAIYAAPERLRRDRPDGAAPAARLDRRGWMVPMIVLGFVVTVAMVRMAHVPFFFRPLQFLIFDPLSVFGIRRPDDAPRSCCRRRPNGTGACIFAACRCCSGRPSGGCCRCRCCSLGRGKAAFAATMLFPRGRRSDVRRSGRAHPAWDWGIATMVGASC